MQKECFRKLVSAETRRTSQPFHLLKEEIKERVEVKATLKANSTRDPDKELKWIYITIGNKRIAIVL